MDARCPEPRLISPASEMAKDALRVLGMAYKYVENTKTELESKDIKDLIFLELQLLIIYSATLFGINPFRTEPFPLVQWMFIMLSAFAGFLIVELEKFLRRRWSKA